MLHTGLLLLCLAWPYCMYLRSMLRSPHYTGLEHAPHLMNDGIVSYRLVSSADFFVLLEQLGSAETYKILGRGGCITLDGVDDAKQFQGVQKAFDTVGMDKDTQMQVRAARRDASFVRLAVVRDTNSSGHQLPSLGPLTVNQARARFRGCLLLYRANCKLRRKPRFAVTSILYHCS